MNDLHELIDEYRCDDPGDTTAAIFDAIRLPERYRSLFFAVVRDECRRMARSATVANLNGTTDDQALSASHETYVVGRAAWLSERIYCGGKRGYVTVGEMTVDDHLARIQFQQSLVNGISRDIERHQEWIAQIEATPNAVCLDDVYVPAVAS
jgi:hypothetical protein